MDQTRRQKVAIGSRLKRARERARLSREEAAHEIRVQPSAIDAWERGSSMPTLPQFRTLLTCYGTMAHRMLFGHNPIDMTADERRELSLAARSFSPKLRTKVDLLLSLLEPAEADQVAH